MLQWVIMRGSLADKDMALGLDPGEMMSILQKALIVRGA